MKKLTSKQLISSTTRGNLLELLLQWLLIADDLLRLV